MRSARLSAAILVVVPMTIAVMLSGSLIANAAGASVSRTESLRESGTPLKIGLITHISGAVSLPWELQAEKLGVAQVNAEGGVMGHKLVLDWCDDHATPTGAALCASQLLNQDKVWMLVGGDGATDNAVLPAVQSANTIEWADGGGSQASLTNSASYSFTPALAEFWVMKGMYPAGTKKIAFMLIDTANAAASFQTNLHYLPKGASAVSVPVPATATSFQTYCLQIKNSGAQVAVPEINPSQIPTVIQTCDELGLTKLTWAIASTSLTPQIVQTLSQAHQPNVIDMTFGGAVKELAAAVKKYGPSAGGLSNEISDYSFIDYIGVTTLPKLAAGANSLDPSKIGAWLNHQTAFSTNGATPAVNFSAAPFSSFPRLKNVSGWRATVEDGKIKLESSNPTILSN